MPFGRVNVESSSLEAAWGAPEGAASMTASASELITGPPRGGWARTGGHGSSAGRPRDMVKDGVRQRLAFIAAAAVGVFLLAAAALFALSRALGPHQP